MTAQMVEAVEVVQILLGLEVFYEGQVQMVLEGFDQTEFPEQCEMRQDYL
jgi:hypothetical protein